MARGNDRRPIFVDDVDRYGFLVLLARTVVRHGWLCHAYCLMLNHFHLVLETPEPNLAAGMRELNGRYAQRFNVIRGRSGHVFGERYKAILVHRETHLLELARYVVLNPVRAGVCGDPSAWPWSSYAATAGRAPCPSFLTTSWLLAQFDDDPVLARLEYVRFVTDGTTAWHEARGLRYATADSALAV
jgi:REP element-mobilizing transposase RayT